MQVPKAPHPSRPTRPPAVFTGEALLAAAVLISGCFGGVTAGADQASVTNHGKPNILLILMDDLGWKDVGFMASPYYETPQIDGLAREGLVFTNAYANAPNCLPSRACLMTGQYTPRHGIYNIAGPDCKAPAYLESMKKAKLKPIPNSRRMPVGMVSLPGALKRAGYATGFVGKWHHGPTTRQSDFDMVVNLKPGLKREGEEATTQAVERDPKWALKVSGHGNEFMRRYKDRPFFLILSHHAVHIPVEARTATVEKYRLKQPDGGRCHPDYAAMVEHADASVGRTLALLTELGIAETTVVVFFSDNGGLARYTSNAPLRGEKQLVYEGGIRVPMIVRWPGHVKPGAKCEIPVIGSDFYATFLELAGASRPSGHVLDGKSLVPLFDGAEQIDREAIFWHIPSYWHRCVPCCVIRRGKYKLIEFFEDQRLELYDLDSDLGERQNLLISMPDKAKELHQIMLEWRRSVRAPVPTEPNPTYERQPSS